MQLEPALRYALDGEAILFAGAGFSMSARNADGLTLPSGNDLAKLLAGELGLKSVPELNLVADMFKDRRGEHALISLLTKRLIAKEIVAEQKIFGNVPWKRIYTTNYDNVMELAFRELNKGIDTLTVEDSPSNISRDRITCLHINGYIQKLNFGSLGSSFVLTNTSYLSDLFNKSRWSRLFREDIEVAKAVIFVGYRLTDLDIARVLYANSDVQKKCCFVVSENPAEETQFLLEKFGTVIPVGIARAGQVLAHLVASHVPAAPALAFHAFRLRKFSAVPGASITDESIFALYVLGTLNLDLLAVVFANEEQRYYLRRSEIDAVISYIDKNIGAVVIHSYLGNGKTLLSQGVAFKAAQRGYEVFEFDRERVTLAAECDVIRRSSKPTLVIIEDYHRHFDVIERLVVERNTHLRFVLTSRTPVHLMEWRKLRAIFEPSEPFEVSVDQLGDGELAALDKIFEGGGLLGKTAAQGVDKRLERFRDFLKSRLAAEAVS